MPPSLAYICLLTLLSLAALPSPGQLEVCMLLKVQANLPALGLLGLGRHSVHIEGGVWKQSFGWLH